MGNDVQTSSTGKKSPLGQCLIVGGGRRFERDGGTGTLDVRVLFPGRGGTGATDFFSETERGVGWRLGDGLCRDRESCKRRWMGVGE